MDTYRAIVDKRDQRAFLPRPIPQDALRRILQAGRMTGSSKNRELGVPAGLHVNRVIGLGYIDPERAGPPKSVGRRRLPLEELTHWEGWRT